MKERVYIETSVISYLCSRPSRDLIAAAMQEVTREWWEDRTRYELFVSQFVWAEIEEGDQDAAAKRQAAVQGIPILTANKASEALARELMRQAKLPRVVSADVAHVAISAVQGMDYLLTWNCAHIANPHWLRKISSIVTACGYVMPVVCTPQALREGV